MRTEKIQPGYRVDPEVHKIVTEYAKYLTKVNGFYVSNNSALASLIKQAKDEIDNQNERG